MTCLYFNASMQLRSKADTFALTYLHKSILILLSGIPVLKDVLCIAWSNEIGNFVEECFWFSSIYCLKWCKMKYIWSSCARLLSTCVCDHRRFSLRRRGALAPQTEKMCVFHFFTGAEKIYKSTPHCLKQIQKVGKGLVSPDSEEEGPGSPMCVTTTDCDDTYI